MEESERRMVARGGRFWANGSVAPGGGWQDSGGLWPGIKLIEGVTAQPDDVEYGFSPRPPVCPRHTLLGPDRIPAAGARTIARNPWSFVHGGMAQNVGPILEIGDGEIPAAQRGGVVRAASGRCHAPMRFPASSPREKWKALGRSLTANFFGPLQTIIPWVSNLYTERLIQRTQAAFGDDFWGFLDARRHVGRWHGFIFAPTQPRGQERCRSVADGPSARLETALPFAMDPVVYDLPSTEHGSVAGRADRTRTRCFAAGLLPASQCRGLPAAGGAQPHAAQNAHDLPRSKHSPKPARHQPGIRLPCWPTLSTG